MRIARRLFCVRPGISSMMWAEQLLRARKFESFVPCWRLGLGLHGRRAGFVRWRTGQFNARDHQVGPFVGRVPAT